MTNLHESLEQLIDYIDSYEEDVVMLFLGDHQPNVKQEKYTIDDKIEEEEAKYLVPFFIYANFDIKEEKNIETSANYLQSILFDVINIKKDSYVEYMSKLRRVIPVITANYYIAEDGNRYMIDDEKSPFYQKIKEYEKMVYYQMFDNASGD